MTQGQSGGVSRDVVAGRAVLTIGVGRPLYLRLALNLARSFWFWHRDSDIRFVLATDQVVDPGAVPPGVSLMTVAPGELPDGFSSKLYLDRLAPAEHTLFIDADCLCVGRLDPLFDRFAGRPVGVVGGSISDGDWFGDVTSVLRRFGLARLPKFNGGLYYVEPGPRATEIYSRARELETQYDALGLVRLRNRPNDELLMAISLALHGEGALDDDGTMLGDPQACRGPLHVSVVKGRATLVNPPTPDPRHQSWYPFHVVHPLVVHFLGDATSSWQYRAEERKLRAVAHGYPAALADMAVACTYGAVERLLEIIRNAGRPFYRRLFGVRAIRTSDRIAL